MSSTLTINTNLASLNAQRRLGQSTASLQKSFERLSSGLRINRPGDDAAGLAVSESLRTDVRVFSVAARNVNDGISMISIAGGALDQLHIVANRITELAEQASNGVLTKTQRRALHQEAQNLRSEYNRIVTTTSFNGKKLLETTESYTGIQAGYGDQNTLFVDTASGMARAAGDGTFSANLSTNTGGGLFNLFGSTLADLNGDGALDAVLSFRGSGTLSVRFGVGDGTFAGAFNYSAFGVAGATVLDINGDGKSDISFGTVAGTNGVLLGNGNGTFKAAINTNGLTAISDMDGDNLPDAISYGGPNASLFRGNGDGTFRYAVSLAVSGGNLSSYTTGDVNGDGRQDIVFSTTVTTSGTNSTALFTGLGGMNFSNPTYQPVGVQPVGVLLADLNGDGFDDIATRMNQTPGITVMLSNGDGTFLARRLYDSGTADMTGLVLADFDGDGNFDFATNDSGNTSRVLMGNGDGTFRASLSHGITDTSSNCTVTAGDLNGDGVDDLFVTTYTDSFYNVLISQTSQVSTLEGFSLVTQDRALDALDLMANVRSRLSRETATLGAFESRLAVASKVLMQSQEAYSAAAAQIREADVATESSVLVRSNILQQAGAAILAQANQQPQLALSLLGRL